MKQSSIIIALTILAGMVLFSGCQKEPENSCNDSNLHEMTFHAGWAEDETKTVLQEGGSVCWSPNDEISVFVKDGKGGSKFVSACTEVSSATTFKGKISDLPSGNRYIAIYPYDETDAVCLEQTTIKISVPTIQIAKEGTFDDGYLKSVAVSEDQNLYFRNLLGGIKFSVANEGIKSITVSSSNGTCLSGPMSFMLNSNGIPSVQYCNNGYTYVTIKTPDGSCFEPGKYYYAITAPSPQIDEWEKEDEFTITYKKDNTEASVNTDYGKKFKRSVFMRFYEGDKGLEFHKSYERKARLSNMHSSLHSVLNAYDKITEMNFYVNSEKTTDNCIEQDINGYCNVYYEQIGTKCYFYTSADVYEIKESNLFSGFSSLKSLDLTNFDTSKASSFQQMFYNCSSLENLDLSCLVTSNVTNMSQMFSGCSHLISLNLSGFDTSRVEDFGQMFCGCISLTSLDLNSFKTPKARQIYDMFSKCSSLSSIDMSGFSSESLEDLSGMFAGCYRLTNLDMGTFDLSKVNGPYLNLMCYDLARRSRNCGILCTQETQEAMQSSSTYLSMTEKYITWFRPGDDMPEFQPIKDPSLYYSEDYSYDKVVKVLQKATAGNGVDLVLMGDAYSDRKIADGSYDQDMSAAVEALFEKEPLKTYRNLFNVYQIYAVSENEVLGESTTFGYYNHGDRYSENGTLVNRDEEIIYDYVKMASGKQDLTTVAMIVIINSNTDDGVAISEGSWSDDDHYDYPAKNIGIAFCHRGNLDNNFKYTVCHEFGHSFAMFFEEYIDRDGEMDEWEKEYMQETYTHLGWWSDIDFTSNPDEIKWGKFIKDNRYSNSGIGVFEGARYSTGIWKPSEESIMNLGGEYNVPCREAIYKKIHKLAYGESWQYDYETFVQQDLQNIESQSAATKSNHVTQSIHYRKPYMKITNSTYSDGNKKVRIIIN